LLAQEVVAKYPHQVTFVSENFGESKLAERFGIKRYPAVFVDDVLIAKPRDFGFFGKGEDSGRYTPWRDPQSHEKFKQDLTRMIDLILSGQKEVVAKEHSTEEGPQEIQTLPKFSLTDLTGKPLTPDQVAGRVVVVEFWATWCPPCRSTLEWLASLRGKYGEGLAVLALNVESPEDEVRKMVRGMSQDLRWAIATPEVATAFGDVVAVPTLFIFDRQGKTAGVWYGASPELHKQVEEKIDGLSK
jgi:cytochrome c biogenesis protein CcmG/thiol:disulfide interchange protein DsbE